MPFDPKRTAVVLIEYQNDFTSEGGALHDAVSGVMESTGMLDNTRKLVEAARAAGATVLMTNHTEFDRAYDRVRLAQLPRAAGDKHPYETDAATVQRYFEMSGLCAEAQRLSMSSN